MEKKTYVRKLTRVRKRSLALVMPAELIHELALREHQKLVVRRSGKKLVVEDWKK